MNKNINTSLSGTFYRDTYIPNDGITREALIDQVRKNAEESNYSLFIKLKESYVVHLDRQFTINLYFRDWERVMPLLKKHYGDGTFYIVNGFRSPYELGDTVHSAGLAIDILVKDQEDADRLMNAAYLTGIPTIIPAGDIEAGQGHIHLDLARKADFTYNAGTYIGPWGDIG